MALGTFAVARAEERIWMRLGSYATIPEGYFNQGSTPS